MSPETGRPAPRDLRLALYVATGVLLGASYVVLDVIAESRLEQGTLTGALAGIHVVIDRTFPILVGALLGVVAHYVRLRAQLSGALEAASRSEALRARLQKVERDQAVWVLAAAVLHELNNPLHALGLLVEELATVDDEPTQKNLLERAQKQADRALAQLEILRSMRGLGEPEMQPVNLGRVLRPLADDVGALAKEEGFAVRLEQAGEPFASADPAYVRTIVENLLDNSLQCLRGGRPAGSSITIGLSVEGGRAVVRVMDDGPAVEANIRATLFDPLRTTKTQGLGLGLPIARALARAMRGDLVLEERDEKTFRLELPRASSASPTDRGGA